MLPALNEIADSQSRPTPHKKVARDILLHYSQTYPNENIGYHAGDMILHDISNAAYLFIPGYCSRIYGHYYLRNYFNNTTKPSDVNPNVPIITKFKTLWHVVGSTEEYDTGGLFINIQKIVPILRALI